MRESWSSRWSFILATTGSAVGLGNIWKFPYMAGENGGGAFVVIYLLCIAVISFPIMISEVLLGRLGQSSPIHTMKKMRKAHNGSWFWSSIGWVGVLSGFIILSFYGVIGGWIMYYVYLMLQGKFVGADSEVVNMVFDHMVSQPLLLIFWFTVFMAITLYILSRGVSRGLELFINWSMPVLFALLFVLLCYAVISGEFGQGFSFLFSFNWGDLSASGILAALGHAFFTLSLGMGAVMVYGSYLPKKTSIIESVSIVVTLDTLIALVAGLIIFPIVFTTVGLQPDEGPGLLFKALPIAFGQLPVGSIFGGLFFVLVFFASVTSAISILEPAVSYMSEEFRIPRKYATWILGSVCWILGLGTVFSFNIWSDFQIIHSLTLFDILDKLSQQFMLPFGGFLIGLYVAYKLPKTTFLESLGIRNKNYYYLLKFLIGGVAPLGIAIIFLNFFGVL